MLFTKSNDPVMLVGPESPVYCAMHSAIKDIRILRKFTHPDEDYPYTKLESLQDIVESLVEPSSCNKMGIARRSMIPYDMFATFREVLPGEWITVDSAMGRLRTVPPPRRAGCDR